MSEVKSMLQLIVAINAGSMVVLCVLSSIVICYQMDKWFTLRRWKKLEKKADGIFEKTMKSYYEEQRRDWN